MKFTWDDLKNTANQKKHGISFEDAIEIFNSETIYEFDVDHSTSQEDRFIAKGTIKKHGLIMVVHCEFNDDTIRIISARRVKI